MLERPELNLLREAGFGLTNPYDAVEYFEKAVAKFTGAPFAVAVDCATHALELCLRLTRAERLVVPRQTYPSVAMLAHKLGLPLEWKDEDWQGEYRLDPYPIVDASLRFSPAMYRPGTLTCLSFQVKKRLPIGRGGMVLLDDAAAYAWLKYAVHDGRDGSLPWKENDIAMIGYHYYMTPEDAARGLLLLRELQTAGIEWLDLGGAQDYPDISKLTAFNL
jgi:dTDP-4-amino-4,6-dideoxygalactose transaminase